jgi:cell division protein FtsB
LDKIKDIFHGPHRKFAWFVVVTTSLFVFLWIVGPGNTFVHWIKAGVEIRRQERLIETYVEKNAELDRKVNMLKHDRDTLEKFAREQFGFSVPGEDVYVIED